MSDKIESPFTYEQVILLNQYQRNGGHPFTCGNDRGDARHVEYQKLYGGDLGELIATRKGWRCPVCAYEQNWAHGMMVDPAWAGPCPRWEDGIRPSLTMWEEKHDR